MLMSYTPPTKETTDLVIYLFKQREDGLLTEDELIKRLNLLQDEGKLSQADREVLGWKIVFESLVNF